MIMWGNEMKVVKYSTEHLVCYETENGHQIFEKENPNEPICIYVNMNVMHLSALIPMPEETYKYFMELGEIIEFLYNMEVK